MGIFKESIFLTIIIFIFILDLIVPPGIAIAVLYMVPITISGSFSKRAIISYSILTMIFAIVATAIYYKTNLHIGIFADRIIAIIVIFITSIITIQYKIVKIRREKEKDKYLNSITEMLFKVSHEVRAPICRMQGLTNLIDSHNISKKELEIISNGLKGSVTELDTFTRDLSDYLNKIQLKS